MTPPPTFPSAPRLLGALFFAASLLVFPGCQKKTVAWDTPGESPPAPATSTLAATTPLAPTAPKAEEPTPAPAPAAPAPSTPASSSLKFVAYNVENWLTMDRYVDGKLQKGLNKPEEEKTAVITILARAKPDILGLCEIGQKEDILDLQSRLKAAGHDLPHLHYSGGGDPTRHLALLSKFPITSTATPKGLEYSLNGKNFTMQRGILDATVDVNGKAYRFLGIHLKSKREVEDGDQAAMRLNEATLLRQHAESILTSTPDARLIAYGDFNDTRASQAIKRIQGSYNHPQYLTPLPLRDRNGEFWTHFWEREDIYSRFDWILVSQALKPEVNFEASHILDDPEWSKASDHRPVMMILK